MIANAFIAQTTEPTDRELTAALGPARSAWDQALATFVDKHGPFDQEWKSYSPKSGWSLRLKRAKRNIVYLSPMRDCFCVSLTLGEKAMKLALECELPPDMQKAVREAVKYPEGYGILLEVNSGTELAPLAKLVTIKSEH
jgi:hypothetical protein